MILKSATAVAALVASSVLAIAIVFIAWPSAPNLATCVENGTDQKLVFTIEDQGSNDRQTAWLEPDASLCMETSQGAVLSAFVSMESAEGCPRIADKNSRDRLLHFLPTDSCRWASHSN